MANHLTPGAVFTAPAPLEEAYLASPHGYLIVVSHSSKPWIIAVDRRGIPLAHTIPGGPGQSTVRLESLSYPVAVVYAQQDVPFVEPHPCGHEERVSGCGGCDPSPVEYVREDGEDEWRYIDDTLEAAAQWLDAVLMAYSRADATLADVAKAASVMLYNVEARYPADGGLVAPAALKEAIGRVRSALADHRRGANPFGELTDAAANLLSRYYEATGRTSGGAPRQAADTAHSNLGQVQ